MRILGVDPGTVVIGYGIIDDDDDKITFVACSVIKCNQHSPMGERLCLLYSELSGVISRYRPDAVAVEQPFVARNARSALAIGKAQAVSILAAANRGIPTYEYSPAQVKRVVTDYGASSKEQVQEMVRLQLGLSQPPQPTDASDALAVAICHIREMKLKSMLAGGQ
jgi:crossover junction endodeoxyribonuclease RuvC